MEKIHKNIRVFMLSCIKHACFHVFSPFSAYFPPHDIIAEKGLFLMPFCTYYMYAQNYAGIIHTHTHTHTHTLQTGEYFGFSLATADLNNDG